jgi:hypothetical protein
MPRGDRRTAVVAAGVVGALVVAAAVFGVGVSSANPKLADIGAWLWSGGKGTVVHANGLSGEVDGRIELKGKAGAKLKVVQDGVTILLVDESTGVISRVDPSGLDVVQTRDFQAAGLQLVVADKAAYAVDPEGSVQRVDPATLNAVGPPVALPRPLGQAGIDGGGRLWVPVPAKGQVTPVQGGVMGSPVTVGEAGDPLALTIAGGLPVITNTRKHSTIAIGSDGRQAEYVLPDAVTRAGDGGVLSPIRTEGPTVPMLAPGADGLLVVVDTASAQVQQVKLGEVAKPAGLGVPQVLGTRVYVPDTQNGRLIGWDTATGQYVPQIQVAQRPGPLDVFVKDGLLWANDENGDNAVVIDPDGHKHAVNKNNTDVPGPTQSPKPRPSHEPRPTSTDVPATQQPQPDPTGPRQTPIRPSRTPSDTPTPTPTPSDSPTPTPTPTPTPKPQPPSPPTSVSARSGPGKIDVMFSPSSTGKVDGYTLKVSPQGGSVSPAKVSGDGPFQFEVTGGDCGTDYTFTVVANWAGGEVPSQASGSAKPCVAPGAPTGFAAKAKNHGADLTWGKPDNAGDSQITYSLSGAATKDGIDGASFSVGNLKNNQRYQFTLKAKNAAGEGQSTASATADLTYPRQQYSNASNNDTNTLIRPGPSGSGEAGKIPKGVYITLTVICQVQGSNFTDPSTGQSSNIWNRIESQYGNGYLNDTLVATPKGGFPAGPLFACDD